MVLVMETADWKGRKVVRFREMMLSAGSKEPLNVNKVFRRCHNSDFSLMLRDHSHCGVGISPSVLL